MKQRLLGKLLLAAAISSLVGCSGNHDDPDLNPSTIKTPQVLDTANEDADQSVENLDIQTETNDAKSTTVRSAEAHTHGGADLAIVLEGRVVTIELDTPLYNVLGFEHSPDTDEQKATVKTAEAILGRGGDLFEFNNNADCVIKAGMKNVTLFEKGSDSDEHSHHHEHHADEDNHKESEHSHDHDHSDTHKDVILQYEFECQKPNALSRVSVNLFEYFNELSEIGVTYLGPSVQRQIELTPNNNSMDMSQ